MRGKCSQICIPVTFVAVGLNGPRTVAGAAGFMSQVSSWLGPPTRNSAMRFTSPARCGAAVAPSVNVNAAAPADAAPTRKKSRRDRREHCIGDITYSFAQDRPSSYQAAEAMQADCEGETQAGTRLGQRASVAIK